jgi:hypothetical protein
MAHLADERTEKFTKLYQRRGYGLKEQIFYKELKQSCAA